MFAAVVYLLVYHTAREILQFSIVLGWARLVPFSSVQLLTPNCLWSNNMTLRTSISTLFFLVYTIVLFILNFSFLLCNSGCTSQYIQKVQQPDMVNRISRWKTFQGSGLYRLLGRKKCLREKSEKVKEKRRERKKAKQRKVKDITRSKVTQEIKEKFLQLLLDMSIFCKGRRLQVQTGEVIFFCPLTKVFT